MDKKVNLDAHGQELMRQYYDLLPILEKLAEDAYDMLSKALQEQGIYVTAMEKRVKSARSLEGKLELKGSKYKTVQDVTDLVGLRVITFYTDEVDKVAAITKRIFDVDWHESVDKRKLHDLTSFGYNSLHFICRMKTGSPRFEIQMRTALQHVWSTIEHDIGYKGEVKMPSEYRRQFSRLSGMMELIDDEFSRLRTVLTDYRRKIQSLVKSGHLDEVPLSQSTFRNYLETEPFHRLNERIAAINQAEIYPTSLMPFLRVLVSFGMETLGDVQRLIDDILASSTALQNLCLIYVLRKGGGREELKAYYDKINGASDANYLLADNILEQAATLPFMKNKE